MQNDTHLKLGEIHSSLEALRQSIDDILQTALVQVSEEEPLKLRFITPSVSLEEWLENERCIDYELTLPEAHESGMEYITVSYCWQHKQRRNGLPRMRKFQLRDQLKNEGVSRPIRCPRLVFHRAMMYARHRKCPYVWIDQECIDQDNSMDVEKHLQIMHRVYKESRWTVAVLSHTLQRDEVKAFNAHLKIYFKRETPPARLQDGETNEETNEETSEETRPVKAGRFLVGAQDDETLRRQIEQVMAGNGAREILNQIRKDRWFTRTWVLQERYCAQNLHLLVPVEAPLIAVEGDSNPMLGFDLLLDTLDELDWIVLSITTRMYESGEPKGIRRLEIIYHLLTEPDIRNDPRPHVWKGNWRPYFHELFRQTQFCDNLVVADRVSILGIICGFPLRLLSNRLDDKKYSYSTCVLALFLANLFPEPAQRRKFLDQYGDSLLRFRMDMITKFHLRDDRIQKFRAEMNNS